MLASRSATTNAAIETPAIAAGDRTACLEVGLELGSELLEPSLGFSFGKP